MLHSGCGAAAETKRESIRDMKWRPADRRAGGRVNGSRRKKVKQEDASNIGTDRVSEVRDIGDECGWVRVSVQRGEEFVNGEIWSSIGGKENVGYVV